MKHLIIFLFLLPSVLSLIIDDTNILKQIDIDKLEQSIEHIKVETGVTINLYILNSTTYKLEKDQINVIWNTTSKTLYIRQYVGISKLIDDKRLHSIKIGAYPLFMNEKYYNGFKYTLNELQFALDNENETSDVFEIIFLSVFIAIGIIIIIIFIIYKFGGELRQ